MLTTLLLAVLFVGIVVRCVLTTVRLVFDEYVFTGDCEHVCTSVSDDGSRGGIVSVEG